jgi:uncharacterized protein YidB (DUF937 family)
MRARLSPKRSCFRQAGCLDFDQAGASKGGYDRRRQLPEEGAMGLLDGVLGGVVGATAATLVKGYIDSHGGVQGVVSQLQASGLGEQVKSWVGTGANLPVSAAQIQQALGSGKVSELAAKFGLPADKISDFLSQHLPGAIDEATPGGQLPPS